MILKDGKYHEDPMLQKVMGRAVCNLPKFLGGGHKRGKFSHFDGTKKVYKCGRCGRETRYTKPAATA